MKILHIISVIVLLLPGSMAYAEGALPNPVLMIIDSAGHFPPLAGDNLNEKQVVLPNDLSAQRTLVLIAFERAQASVLDSWSKGLDLPNSQIPWIETPIISSPFKLGSMFIASGMRRGIPNPAVRERVITLYTDRAAFAKAMGFEYDKNEAYVAIIDHSGKNLGMVKGAYDEAKAKAVLALLGEK